GGAPARVTATTIVKTTTPAAGGEADRRRVRILGTFVRTPRRSRRPWGGAGGADHRRGRAEPAHKKENRTIVAALGRRRGVASSCDACPMAAEPRPQLVLDSPSLFYRAFFALPTSLRDPQGEPINAVRGSRDMVAWLTRGETPERVVHTLDADWRPAWRVAAWPGYKAERAADP